MEPVQKANVALDALLNRGTSLKQTEVTEVERLWRQIGTIYIPTAPADVAVGIPADLLRRRPDVRRAERQAAAQSEQIGIAAAELYPHFSLDGNLGFRAAEASRLLSRQAFTGQIGPSFQWNLLNYGRIVNNVRFQEATYQQLVADYQIAVLQAARQVEDGLVNFLKAQESAILFGESVDAEQRAVIVALQRMYEGITVVNDYAQIQTNLVGQDDAWAQARGQIALGLIQTYRALGGGWQIRLKSQQQGSAEPAAAPAAPSEKVPTPPPAPIPEPIAKR